MQDGSKSPNECPEAETSSEESQSGWLSRYVRERRDDIIDGPISSSREDVATPERKDESQDDIQKVETTIKSQTEDKELSENLKDNSADDKLKEDDGIKTSAGEKERTIKTSTEIIIDTEKESLRKIRRTSSGMGAFWSRSKSRMKTALEGISKQGRELEERGKMLKASGKMPSRESVQTDSSQEASPQKKDEIFVLSERRKEEKGSEKKLKEESENGKGDTMKSDSIVEISPRHFASDSDSKQTRLMNWQSVSSLAQTAHSKVTDGAHYLYDNYVPSRSQILKHADVEQVGDKDKDAQGAQILAGVNNVPLPWRESSDSGSLVENILPQEQQLTAPLQLPPSIDEIHVQGVAQSNWFLRSTEPETYKKSPKLEGTTESSLPPELALNFPPDFKQAPNQKPVGGGIGDQMRRSFSMNPDNIAATGDTLLTEGVKRVQGVSHNLQAAVERWKDEDEPQILRQASQKFKDLILDRYPFDLVPRSFCLFGSFSDVTLALDAHQLRPVEMLGPPCPAFRMNNKTYTQYTRRLVARHFAFAATSGIQKFDGRNDTIPIRSQFFFAHLGSLFKGTKIFGQFQGKGPRAAELSEWLAFHLCRKILSVMADSSPQFQRIVASAKSLRAEAISSVRESVHLPEAVSPASPEPSFLFSPISTLLDSPRYISVKLRRDSDSLMPSSAPELTEGHSPHPTSTVMFSTPQGVPPASEQAPSLLSPVPASVPLSPRVGLKIPEKKKKETKSSQLSDDVVFNESVFDQSYGVGYSITLPDMVDVLKTSMTEISEDFNNRFRPLIGELVHRHPIAYLNSVSLTLGMQDSGVSAIVTILAPKNNQMLCAQVGDERIVLLSRLDSHQHITRSSFKSVKSRVSSGRTHPTKQFSPLAAADLPVSIHSLDNVREVRRLRSAATKAYAAVMREIREKEERKRKAQLSSRTRQTTTNLIIASARQQQRSPGHVQQTEDSATKDETTTIAAELLKLLELDFSVESLVHGTHLWFFLNHFNKRAQDFLRSEIEAREDKTDEQTETLLSSWFTKMNSSEVKKLFVLSALSQSEIKRWNLTRGLGFWSQQYLGMNSVPDYFVLNSDFMKSPHHFDSSSFGSSYSTSKSESIIKSNTYSNLIPSSESYLHRNSKLLVIISPSLVFKFLSSQTLADEIANLMADPSVTLQETVTRIHEWIMIRLPVSIKNSSFGLQSQNFLFQLKSDKQIHMRDSVDIKMKQPLQQWAPDIRQNAPGSQIVDQLSRVECQLSVFIIPLIG